jgi:hypothetical protein
MTTHCIEISIKTKTKNRGKSIKFVYFINGDVKGELCLKECAKPSDFKYIELISYSCDNQYYDVMLAYNEDRRGGQVYLGFWNDGVVKK